jgi:transposase InsO family protein
VVKQWKEPTTVRGVQSFLGFCNFYRKFVREYGRIAKPLNTLTKKGEGFLWTQDCQIAFDELKRRLLTAPILRHFSYDQGVDTQVETDASDGVLAGVLLQKHPQDEDWHPVAFYSETMQGPEHNYPIHDKELMAVVRALIAWRAELIGLPSPFTVITDHRALEFFSKKRLLNLRQAGWAEIMAQYHFTITFRPGQQNVLADALSRKAEDVRTQKGRQEKQRTMRIFKPVQDLDAQDDHSDDGYGHSDNVDIEELNESDPSTWFRISEVDGASQGDGILLTDEVLRQNQTDESLEGYREKARQGDDKFSLLDGKFLLFRGRLAVSEVDDLRTKIIREIHDRITTAHPGRNKTRQLVMAQYWWPGMASDIDTYVANCVTCRASKVPRDKTPGLLQPLPIPEQPWRDLVMDFKKMPESKKGRNNLLVMIDRLSKISWSSPTRDSATAALAALLYYEGPYRVFGLPRSVVSDRGPQFVSEFRQEMCKILNINWKLSTSGHSQTAGQAEIMNEYIDQRLRPYINHYQDDWDDMMPALDAVQASLPHDSLGGLQPHEVILGYPMPMHFDWAARTTDWSEVEPRDRLSREDAQKHVQHLVRYTEAAREAIKKAQEVMITQANKKRRAPDFGIGDRVFVVKKQGWSTTRPSDKLDFPMTRVPYEIIGKVKDNVFKLKVPDGWRATDQFNAERLRKYPNNPLPGQAPPNPAGDLLDGEEEWEVERITASRLYHKKLQYQVVWKGWDPDPTWYYADGFKNATAQLRAYHEKHPDQAGPPLRIDQWEQAALREEFDPPHKDDNEAASTRTGTRARARGK